MVNKPYWTQLTKRRRGKSGWLRNVEGGGLVHASQDHLDTLDGQFPKYRI
jgi:hypothetical protein